MRACLAFNAAEAAAKAASAAVADALVVALLVAALRVFAFVFLRCRFRCFLLGGSAFWCHGLRENVIRVLGTDLKACWVLRKPWF